MTRTPIMLLLIMGTTLLSQGCARRGGEQAFQIKGSDTMVNLGQAWAEEYAKEHPGANVTVTGGGSGTGIAALINGDTDIAQASRRMEAQELNRARAKGMNPQEFVVARDGVSIIVNPGNPVGRLTTNQLSAIYTGTITNWKQVGGEDSRIVVLSRDKSSGTHVFFLQRVVRQGSAESTLEYGKSVLMLPSSQAIADEVAGNQAAIGYVGIGYVDEARHKLIAVAVDEDSPYVEPTLANVVNGTYPIARPLYLYTAGEPKGIIKDFIDFALGDEGQKIVEKVEFVPVSNGS